jgi:hypothetical protein
MRKNLEVENKAIYGEYCDKIYGQKYYICLIREFRKIRRRKCKEVHELHEILDYRKIYSVTESDYERIRKQGLDYYFNSFSNYHNHGVHNIFENKEEDMMHPLLNLNMDYAKKKLHILEVELCYINANIKSISKILRGKEFTNKKLKEETK